MRKIKDNIPLLRPTAVLTIEVGDRKFYAHFEDNPAAKALFERLKIDLLTVRMCDRDSREKIGELSFALPQDDRRITPLPGDLVLYENGRIALCYDQNTENGTRLARIGNTAKEALLDVLGSGDVALQLYLEWSE